MSTGRNLTGMRALVQAFNDGNPWGILVDAHTPGGQGDLEQAMQAAIAGGALPNVTMGFANTLAAWHARGAIRPLNDLMAHSELGLSSEAVGALAPAALAAGTLAGGVQMGLPLHQSAQVLFYNYTWAQALGFAAPPATSAEFMQQACAAAAANNADASVHNDGTGGYVYFPDASMVSPWIWAFDGSYVNRAGDGYVFDNPVVVDVALFFKVLYDSGCTLATRSFPNPEFARRQALFVTGSTAGILFQQAAMDDVGNADVWGAIPYPGPSGTLAVNAFSHLVGVVPASPEAEMASWLFLRWLASPEAQALWLGYTNYFPALARPDIGSRAQQDPVWVNALALLPRGRAEPNFPEHGAVRGAMRDAFFAILEAPDEAAVRAILAGLDGTARELAAEHR
jgi:ABC-type glycerol-3-phosphate transport system substrate-binding protein